jgi:hypothetical protein
MKSGKLILAMSCLALACQNNPSTLDAKGSQLVDDSVRLMVSGLTNDLSVNGPVAWLNYFEESPDFFMAADGQLAFQDYQAGKTYVEDTLRKAFVKINLQFNQLRIDPLTSGLASIGAIYHEDLTDSAGKMIHADGFVTALVKHTPQGWKFENLHWSMSNSNKP